MREIKFKIKWNDVKILSEPFSVNEMCRRVPSNMEQVGVLLQFTGLRDKNGKEIYESDILLVDDRRTVLVYWHELAGAWDTKFIEDSITDIHFNSLKNANMYLRAEVIGNIYENPELLTNGK